MDRRSFIKLTAITGSTAALASCGSPENHVIRFVPDEEIVPGIAEWKPSVCPLCASGCGVTVRVMPADVETTREGQAGLVRLGVAKKLEGNPTHPVNQGALCARGQAAIQLTYHPDRITQPLKRSGTRGDGKFDAITWEAAIAELVSKLDAAAGDPRALAIVTGGRRSHRALLFDQFASKFGAAAPVSYELFGNDVLRRANALSFGHAQLPTFDLANARYVISFGADFLGTWNSPVAHGAAYGRMRQGRPGVRGALVQVESRMTNTGAVADEWIAVKPGTEGVLALGLAHVILAQKLRPVGPDAARVGALVDGWSGGLAQYAPDAVSRITGISAERVERLARAFAEQQPGVAIVGGAPLAQTNGLFTAVAVNALNALVGSVGQPGGLQFTPQIPMAGPAAPLSSLDKFAGDVLSEARPAQVLLVDGVNPVFSAPAAWKVREAFDKIPFIVSFGSFIDETSARADLILPDHTFLESWSDALPESGSTVAVASVGAPVMKPLFDTRAAGDVLLDAGRKLAKPIDLGWQTYDEMLKATFDRFGEDAWSTAQKQGGFWGAAPAATGGATRPGGPGRPGGSSATAAAATPAATSSAPLRYAEPQYDGDAAQFPLQLLPYPSHAFLDGSLAHLSWLQELPDPLTSAIWSSWVEINPKTAAQLGISLGDVVEIASRVGVVRAAAFISPGIAPNIVAMPVGQGHTNYTRYASNRGANPVAILAPVAEPATGALAWAATRVKVTKVGGPDGKLILFSARGELYESPHEGRPR
jgi:anaerobic selenocysteine-containing dehydrogenase